jgi:hypothetical protein
VHGPFGSKRTIRIDIDDDKPHTILFDSHGEFLTGEALRWCARYGIGLILPDGPSRMMTFLHSALEADGNGVADTSPAMIRAQCRTDTLGAARELVRAKIERGARGNRKRPPYAPCEARGMANENSRNT